jgi:hypothetical protein
MVSIRASSNHTQAQIDFCRRSNLHAPLVNIASLRMRKASL